MSAPSGLKVFCFSLRIRKVLSRHLFLGGRWATAVAELCLASDWQLSFLSSVLSSPTLLECRGPTPHFPQSSLKPQLGWPVEEQLREDGGWARGWAGRMVCCGVYGGCWQAEMEGECLPGAGPFPAQSLTPRPQVMSTDHLVIKRRA